MAGSRNRGPLFELGNSMSSMGGSGWRFRSGYMGSGAAVFPDSDQEAGAFLKSLQRTLTPADKGSWSSYASRIGMAPDEAERVWQGMMKPSLRPALQAAVDTINDVFEGTSWVGYSGPNVLNVKTYKGGETFDPPPRAPEKPVKPGKYTFAAAPASFPYHTDAARSVWAEAEKLIGLYPLDNPVQILRRAVSDAEVDPVTDLTPEDERLLRMAIEFAQNGPPPSVARIGGTPGGPFRSDDASHSVRGKGAP